MRFSALALLAFAAPAVLAVSVRDRVQDVDVDVQDQLTFAADGAMHGFDNPDDPCPDLVVRCIRDGNVIGDIGEKSFCHKGGLKCRQCHTKINTAECNTKYLKDCATKCEAVGSPI
ncbi:uncharacterized protein JCM10292_005548 [Rhodotorula paludigena]|uniref:uncharacterized protein n=1 Tax=Rhodotorula paludigena TaxID=86838 RepID=UPI00316EF961